MKPARVGGHRGDLRLPILDGGKGAALDGRVVHEHAAFPEVATRSADDLAAPLRANVSLEIT